VTVPIDETRRLSVNLERVHVGWQQRPFVGPMPQRQRWRTFAQQLVQVELERGSRPDASVSGLSDPSGGKDRDRGQKTKYGSTHGCHAPAASRRPLPEMLDQRFH